MSKKLLQKSIRPAEYDRIVWSVTPEADVSLKDLMAPDYWAHVAKTLKPGARIEVLPENRSWFAELIVRSSTDNSVNLAVLRHLEFDSPVKAADNGDPYEIKHRGGAGWSVIRKSDKVPVFEKGQSKLEAERWLADHTELA